MTSDLAIRVYANLSELRKQMAETGTLLGTTTRHLASMSSAFDGATIVSRAHAAAAAIQKIGGVASLTSAEQARVNKTLGEAIEKYKALGQTAPGNLLQIYEATKKARGEIDDTTKSGGLLQSSFMKLAGAFSVGSLIDRGIGSLISLGKEAFSSAGDIMDLADKTGLSIRAVQQLGYTADLSGSNLEQWADTVFRLGVNLQQGTAATRSAVSALGLEYERIRTLQPEVQFDQVMRALAGVESITQRNRLGVELMGKAYANVAIAVDSYNDKMADAPVIGDKAVQAMDAAAEAMERAWAKAKNAAIAAIGGIVLALEDFNARNRVDVVVNTGPAHAAPGVVNPFAPSGLRTGISERIGHAAKATQDIALTGQRVVPPLTPEQLAALREAERAARAYRLELDRLTGRALQREIEDLSKKVTDAGSLSAHQFMLVGQHAQEMQDQGGQLTGVLEAIRVGYERIAFAQRFGIGTARTYVESMQRTVQVSRDQIDTMGMGGLVRGIDQLVLPGKKVTLASPAPTFAQIYGQQLGQTIVQAATGGGNVGEALGAKIGNDLGAKLAKEAGAKVTGFFTTGLGRIVTGALPGIGALAGPLIGKALGALGNALGFGTAGRDLVVTFAEKMGGFDALREKLADLGDQGEILWKQLTQGVGRNNADEAKRAIDQVERALANYEQRQQRVAELQEQLQGTFGSLTSALDVFGGRAPAAVRPLVQELLNLNGLTAEQTRLLNGLLEAPSWQAAEEAAGRLGVKLSSLGPAFQQAKLSEQALQTARDLETVIGTGADLDTVLKDAADHIQGLVTTAMQTGSVLPETLKPYIQRLIDMGKLVDPRGELVTNIDQLSFADIKDDALTVIKDLLEDIRDLLANKIPAAAEAASSAIGNVATPDVPDLPTAPNPQYNADGTARAHRGAMVMRGKILAFHRGGMIPRLRPDEVPAILQEGEGVLSRSAVSAIGGPSAVRALNTGGSAGQVITLEQGAIVINAPPGTDARQIVDEVMRQLPRRLRASGM